jgi:hypothetical protein
VAEFWKIRKNKLAMDIKVTLTDVDDKFPGKELTLMLRYEYQIFTHF